METILFGTPKQAKHIKYEATNIKPQSAQNHGKPVKF